MNARRPASLAALAAAVGVALASSSLAAVHRTAALRDAEPPAAVGALPDAGPTTAALARAALSTGPTASTPAGHRSPTATPSGAAGGADGSPGLHVSLALRQQTVSVGDLVEADLAVADSDGIPAEYVLDWGDGAAHPNRPAASCGPAVAGPRSTHWTNRVEYSYRQPGRYTVSYRIRTLTCTGGPAEERLARAVITVVDGPLPTNGGRRPQGFLSMFSRDQTLAGTVVDVQGQDHDGWVTQMIVDFGDGRAARLVENPTPCAAPRGEWPTTPYFSHRFESPYQVVGRYTVTLTVFTAGCDGSNVQQTTVRQQVVVPQPVA